MEKELVIHNTSNGVEIALLEDKKLVEFHQEKQDNRFKVGDVLLGRVRKVMPGMNAAFVDVGFKKDAFLHYSDLGSNLKTFNHYFKPVITGNINDPLLKRLKYLPELDKRGNIKDVIKSKDLVVVQVFKEAISTKGPRITTEISLSGRFLILKPFSNFVALSKKIKNREEKKRLEILLSSLKPENFGVIIRTSAEGKIATELHKDLQNLLEKWDGMLENLKNATFKKKVYTEIDKSSSVVRDLFSDNFTAIHTGDKVLATELEDFILNFAPDKKDILKLYSGKNSIFDNFGVTKQIKSSFGKTVGFGKGQYLVIEHTEALHVVDVNSGFKTGLSGNQEENALSVNLGAIEELARQLRLRDIGGIIVVDCIDMKKADSRKQVNDKIKDLLKRDKAITTVLPLSKFNLMQITRQRVRPQVVIKTKEVCPTCAGTGKIESSILLIDDIKHKIEYLINNNKPFTLSVHPYLHAYINKGLYSLKWKWSWNYKQIIKILADNNLPLTSYQFKNNKGEIYSELD